MLVFSLYDRIWSKYLFCLTELLHSFLSLGQLHSLLFDFFGFFFFEEFFNVSFFVLRFVYFLITSSGNLHPIVHNHFPVLLPESFVWFFTALSSLLACSLFQESSFVKSHVNSSLDDKDTTSSCTLLSVRELNNRCTDTNQ